MNYALDVNDPLLGFAVEWADELASHFERTLVLTGRIGSEGSDVVRAENVGWVEGQTARNIWRLERAFVKALRIFRPDIIFVHMAAPYAALIGPIAKANSVPMVLWYEHQAPSRELSLAERFSAAVVSASPSYPGRKAAIVVGHGISTRAFPPKLRTPYPSGSELLRAIHVGRADPVKAVDTIVADLAAARHDSALEYTLTQLGHSSGNHRGILSQSVHEQYPWVSSFRSVPRQQVLGWLDRHDFFVHAYAGAIDKAPLEASLAGLPVVSRGARVFEALGGRGSPRSIDEQLRTIRAWSSSEICDLVRRQQDHVLRHHSLAATAKRISDILRSQASS